jgi:two-component system response regulator QseB
MRVLLIEDDTLLAEGIEVSLRLDKLTVDVVHNGEHALHALLSEDFDIAILDLGLPKMSGYEVLKKLRSKGNMTPVLILTARDAVEDRVKGLDFGADDYLLKPFDVDELKARLRAIVRRQSGQRTPDILIGHLKIDPSAHRVFLDEVELKLSPKEFMILAELASHRGKTLSKEQLMRLVYGWQEDLESNSLEVHMHNLRKKIGNGIIHTVRGIGYRIDQ